MSPISCFLSCIYHTLITCFVSVQVYTHEYTLPVELSPRKWHHGVCWKQFILFQTQGAIITAFLSICHCQELFSFVVKVCVRAVQGHDLVCKMTLATIRTASFLCNASSSRCRKDICFPFETEWVHTAFQVQWVLVCDVDCAVCCRALGLHVRSVDENSRSKREGIFQDDDCIIKINDTELMDKSFSQ